MKFYLLSLLQVSSSIMTVSLVIVSTAFYLEVSNSNGTFLIQFHKISYAFNYFIDWCQGVVSEDSHLIGILGTVSVVGLVVCFLDLVGVSLYNLQFKFKAFVWLITNVVGYGDWVLSRRWTHPLADNVWGMKYFLHSKQIIRRKDLVIVTLFTI